jgi:hypothetical protein
MSRVGEAARSWLTATAGALAIVVALGWLPTRRLAGGEGFVALAAAVAVAWLAAALGAVPVLGAVARGGARKPVVVVGQATALRAGATIVGALVAVLGSELPRTVFVIWLALAYGVLLVVETRWTTRWLEAGGR